ncbi:hypothetical protein Tco_1080723 [Tanacetum coccineum]|uniref:Uncharacterized protein n=1 Tax=Tanacetum coccineum TaxID=301880 RepID=A0ABQ5HVK7_9ASTR
MLSSDAQVGVVSNNSEGVLDEEVNGGALICLTYIASERIIPGIHNQLHKCWHLKRDDVRRHNTNLGEHPFKEHVVSQFYKMERWQRAELLMARRNMVMLAQQQQNQQNQQWPDTTYELYEYE